MRLRQNLQIGLLARFSYARRERESIDASTASADLRLGIRLGNLDATFGLLRRHFKDISAPSQENKTEAVTLSPGTDSNGYLFDLRLRLKLTPQVDFYPSAGFENSSFALGLTQQNDKVLHLGLGFNIIPSNHTSNPQRRYKKTDKADQSRTN